MWLLAPGNRKLENRKNATQAASGKRAACRKTPKKFYLAAGGLSHEENFPGATESIIFRSNLLESECTCGRRFSIWTSRSRISTGVYANRHSKLHTDTIRPFTQQRIELFPSIISVFVSDHLPIARVFSSIIFRTFPQFQICCRAVSYHWLAFFFSFKPKKRKNKIKNCIAPPTATAVTNPKTQKQNPTKTANNGCQDKAHLNCIDIVVVTKSFKFSS